MDDVLVKACSKCGELLVASEFSARAKSLDGLHCWCRACVASYNKSYFATDIGKDARNRGNRLWRQSEKGRAYFKRPEVLAKLNAKVKRYRDKGGPKVDARDAVRRAKRRGELARPSTIACLHCGAQARDYHHHKGYDPEHHLDVIPLCRPCHLKADSASKKAG